MADSACCTTWHTVNQCKPYMLFIWAPRFKRTPCAAFDVLLTVLRGMVNDGGDLSVPFVRKVLGLAYHLIWSNYQDAKGGICFLKRGYIFCDNFRYDYLRLL